MKHLLFTTDMKSQSGLDDGKQFSDELRQTFDKKDLGGVR